MSRFFIWVSTRLIIRSTIVDDVFLGQLVEHDRVVDPVEELRPEVRLSSSLTFMRIRS